MQSKPFKELFAIPLRNGLTKPKAVRGKGTKMVNMGELFANPRMTNITMDRVPLNQAERNSSLLAAGDLLFARQSLVLSGAGKCSIFVNDDEEVCFESHVIRCRLNRSLADPDFYFYFFCSSIGRKLIESIVEQGAGASGIRGSDLAKLEVPWVDLAIQIRVAAVLRHLDDKIECNRRINQTLEAMAQAIFKSWFVDFDPVKAKIAAIAQGQDPLRAAMRAISGKTDAELDQMPREQYDQLAATAALFPDAMEESELGEIPKGWTAGKLEDLLVLQRGFDLPSVSREPGSYPIIAASGPAGTHSAPMAKGPGVVTGRSGVLGKVFLELNDFWPLNTTLWVKEFRAASPCYAYEALKLLDFSSFNAGSAVPTLNRNHIHSLPHLIPDKKCVAAYESFALMLHQQVLSKEEQSRGLAQLRDTLLPKLLSGELSVENIPVEVAH